MKIALIGCGAMGSLYGGYLSKVHEVTVCDVSAALIDAINANGIIMDEPNGETVVFKPACATTDSSTVGVQDLVITFVNYKFLESALNTAKGMIGPNTIVMSLQNGMGNAYQHAGAKSPTGTEYKNRKHGQINGTAPWHFIKRQKAEYFSQRDHQGTLTKRPDSAMRLACGAHKMTS